MKTPLMLRRALIAALAGALTFGAAGCSDGDKNDQTATAAEAGGDSAPQDGGAAKEDLTDPQDGSQPQDDSQTLAQVAGGNNLVLTITGARRGTSGKWVTIQGRIKNDGDKKYIHTSLWGTGELEDIRTNPRGVSGASITSEATQKRYFVLRDTDGRCACTTQITEIGPGESAAFAAQFPAPQQGAEVGFQLPTFPVATVKMSG